MRRGMALVTVIFMMILLGLLGVVVLPMLTTGLISGINSVASARAYGLAYGGKEWYLQELAGDLNWSNNVNQSDIVLGSGTFDISIESATRTEITFVVTGKTTAAAEKSVQNQMRLTARKLPKASLFALFWGRDNGSVLQFRKIASGTHVYGDCWFRGTALIRANCSITQGLAYYADSGDVVGPGTYVKEAVPASYPTMPQIDETYYDFLMNNWDNIIDTAADPPATNTINLSSDITLNGNTINCRTFNTNGYNIYGNNFTINCRNFRMHANTSIDATNFMIRVNRNFNTWGNNLIAGSGYIVKGPGNGILELLGDNADVGSLNVIPSGGGIYFLSARNLVVNGIPADTTVNIAAGTYLYSRSQASNNFLVRVRNSNTLIDNSLVIARRRVIVESGATIADSTIYVSDVSNNNNYLLVSDAGTTVSGSVISVSGRQPGLMINNGAKVTGLVYHWGANTGTTLLAQAYITGCVIASQFQTNRIIDSYITQEVSALPNPPPDGFNGYVIAVPGSWDDN
ncbi:MAG: hypothetical protein HQ596_07790 [Candidatus Saganbacteria bacterium]|nr:hypothetical protein [Candidatus Saganbacteria bacterium]